MTKPKVDIFQGTFCLSCSVCGDVSEADDMVGFRKIVDKHLKEYPEHTELNAIRMVFLEVRE